MADDIVIPDDLKALAGKYAAGTGTADAGSDIVIPDDIKGMAGKYAKPAQPVEPKKPGLMERAGKLLSEGRSQPDPSLSGITPEQARGMVGEPAAQEPAAQPPPAEATGLSAAVPRGRRGGLRSEAQPFVAGFAARENATPAPKTAGQLLETPGGPTLSAEQQLAQEREQGSKSPALLAREQADAERAAREVAPQEARPLEITNRITTGIRENVQNPALRGLIAGGAELGKVGTGAVRLAADVMGADNVAKFAKGAEQRAGATSTGSTQDLKGNDKLVADIFSSIVNSAPSMALGVAGVGQKAALNTLFAQSTLQEYGAGRDAGFGVGESLSRATIMGYSEALGEKFGFGEQIKLLKSVTKNLPSNEVAKVFGAMLVKEIPGEQLTTAMQFLADKIGPAALRPNASITDYLEAAGETLKVTIGQTLLMGGGPALIAETKNQYRKADTAMGARPVSPVESFLTPPQQEKPLPPTQIRTESIRRFDEMAAQFGMNPKSVAAAKSAAADMPAGEVPGFLGRMAEALQKRGLVAKPIDEQGLAGLSEALDGKPDAAKDEAVSNIEATLKAAGALPDEAINAPGLVDGQNDTGLDETLPRKIAGEPNLSALSDSTLQLAGEVGAAGEMTRGMGIPDADWKALKVAGLVQEGTQEDGTTYEYVPAASLGAERDRRFEAARASRKAVSDDEKAAGRERRAQNYERVAAEKEQAGFPDDAAELRRRAAEIRAGAPNEQSVVPDPAPSVSGTGPDGPGAAGVSGGTVRPVADDAQRGNADDPAAAAASGRPGDDAGRGRGDDAALSGEPIAALRKRWPGLADMPDSHIRAAQSWSDAQDRVRAAYEYRGNKDGEIQDALVEEWGQKRIAADREGYLAELTKRLNAEADRMRDLRDTPGTLPNKRQQKQDDERRNASAEAERKATAQDIEFNLERVREMRRQGRINDADEARLLDLARSATNGFDAAMKLEDFVSGKSVASGVLPVGRGADEAANAAAPVTTQAPAQAGATEAAAPAALDSVPRGGVGPPGFRGMTWRQAVDKIVAEHGRAAFISGDAIMFPSGNKGQSNGIGGAPADVLAYAQEELKPKPEAASDWLDEQDADPFESEKLNLTRIKEIAARQKMSLDTDHMRSDGLAATGWSAESVGTSGKAAAPRVIGKYGRTPNGATEIELRPNADGTLTPHTGKYPMVDFESGNPISLPADVTDAQAAKAIRDAGAVTAKDKFYGVKEDAAPAAAPAAPAPQATPEELLSAAEKRVDGLKALLACLTS